MRVIVLADGGADEYAVFDALSVAGGVARVRSPLLFEVGEELVVRVEEDGKPPLHATARVRAHVDGVTELELVDRAAPR
jgi:hypothetical protein